MDSTKIIPIETANKMLSLVAPIIMDIQEKWKVASNKLGELGVFFSPDGDGAYRIGLVVNALRKATKGIGRGLDELEQLGCSIEDIEQGIVDFPSIIDNEEVMLCWKLGEDEILHYHKRGENIRHRLLIKQVLE